MLISITPARRVEVHILAQSYQSAIQNGGTFVFLELNIAETNLSAKKLPKRVLVET